MPSKKQIAANRRNARKSTGPRTPEGKARASRNALKTGLYADGLTLDYEDPSALKQLEAWYTLRWNPADPDERALVDILIHCEWMLRRYRWLDTEMWKAGRSRLSSDQFRDGVLAGCAQIFMEQPSLYRLHRLRNSTQKEFRETLDNLLRLQAKRAQEPPLEYIPQPKENSTTSPQNGFVPSNSDVFPENPASAV